MTSEKATAKWEITAHKEQNAFCHLLGDRRWDKLKPEDGLELRRKIGYGLYGPPNRNPNPNAIKDIGYTTDEDDEINKIYNLIMDQGMENKNLHTWFACIFISCNQDDKYYTIPVFRILKDHKKDPFAKDNCTFIDQDCRVYQSWDDYINNNKLPPCLMIYPKDGIYQLKSDGNVDCVKNHSNADSTGSKVLEVADYAATAVGIAASVVGLAAIFAIPIAGPIVVAAIGAGAIAGGYGAVRSSTVLVDRYKHNQSIGLDNAESRNCWLNIVTTPLFFTEFGMLARLKFSTQAGNIASKAFRVAYSAINVASFTTSGLSILNSFYVIIEKEKQGTLTALDIYQFTASCIFFGHSSMNLKTASKIIKNVQKEHISSYKKYLNTEDEHRDFETIISKMQSERKMQDSAKIIKELNQIKDKEDFIHSLIDVERKHDFEKGDISIDRGLINIKNEWYVHPKKLSQIEEDSIKDIMINTKKFQDRAIDLPRFKTSLSKICSKYRLRSEAMRANTVSTLAAHFDAPNLDNIEVNGLKIFKNMPGHIIDRLNGVMENTAKNYSPDIINIGMKFAKKENCQNVGEFCSYLEYSVKYMNDVKNEYIKAYNEELKRNPSVSKKVVGKVKTFFEKKVYEEFLNDETKLNEMSTRFNETKQLVTEANREAEPYFMSDVAATYHYFKHKDDLVINNGDISPQDYLNIARTIANDVPVSAMLSQEGNVTFLTFKDQDGVMVIGIQPNPNGNMHIATCFRLHKK